MAYYVNLNKRAYAFATKKDALIFACDQLHHEHQRIRVFKDRACTDPVCTVEYVGLGIYNYFKGNSLSWKGQPPMEVDPKDGSVHKAFA